MPVLRSDTSALINAPPTSNSVLRNPFLIFRLVFLALLTNLAFLSLVFASWNVNATLSVGLSAPSTSIFIILESCLVFFCVGLATADFFRPQLKFSRTLLECIWVGALSMFQTGAAISASINGPALACRATSNWDVCASSSLLMPLTWLSSMLSLAYFFALFITTMAHKTQYSDIWRQNVCDIEWFGQMQRSSSKESVVRDFLQKSPSYEDDPYSDYYEDIESTAARKNRYFRDSIEEAAPWAVAAVRRGVDPPFAKKQTTNSNRSTPTFNMPLPSLPTRSATSNNNSGSRFVEKFRESSVLARSESPTQFAAHYHTRSDSFPPSVADIDQPIPLPRLSEWVRADWVMAN